jgi:hypothetical protein
MPGNRAIMLDNSTTLLFSRSSPINYRSMRRIVAVLMLVVFGSFLSAPLLAASSDPQSSLPACCRRDGQHHCMMGMMQSQTGSTLASVGSHCPFFPQPGVAIDVQPHAIEPAPAGVFYAALQSHPAVHAQTEAQGRISLDRSHQKRGPPARLLMS